MIPQAAVPLILAMCDMASAVHAAAPSDEPQPSPSDDYKLFPGVRHGDQQGWQRGWLVHLQLTVAYARALIFVLSPSQLPPIRSRGVYAMDAKNARNEQACSKQFSRKAKFTAGIFTLVCPHGTRLGRS